MVEGNHVGGGSWKLVTSDDRVVLYGVMPPHSFWPNLRYAISYALIEVVKELFRTKLVGYARSSGYQDLAELMRHVGKEHALKSYRYLYLSGRKAREVSALLIEALRELGIAKSLNLVRLDRNTFVMDNASESVPRDSWFLRGLALTDGCRSSCSFASPKTELIATLVANCNGRISLKDSKLWLSTNEVKITLEYATSCRLFNWIDLLEGLVLRDTSTENACRSGENLRNGAHSAYLLPCSETDGMELLAGIIMGDGYVNRMTGAITISLNVKTPKGRLLLNVVKHLEQIGVLEIRSGPERLSKSRELRVYVGRKLRHILARLIPYYKGYRIVNRHYDPVLWKTSVYTYEEKQVDLNSVRVDNQLVEIIKEYLGTICLARIRFSGSTVLHITCSDADACEEFMNKLKKLGLNPIKNRETRRTFSIAKHKEALAYTLYRYGKLKLDTKTQPIFVTWIKMLHNKP